jgi:hypothetical protein
VRKALIPSTGNVRFGSLADKPLRVEIHLCLLRSNSGYRFR